MPNELLLWKAGTILVLLFGVCGWACAQSTSQASPEKQITFAPTGHILTNVNVWSPDSCRIVYDTRPDPSGGVFEGHFIETVDVTTGEVRRLYESRDGARCGVVTFSPAENRVAFILGPDHPTPDWSYGANRRRGVFVDESQPGVAHPIDARDLTEPFTPGALRGGTHVHVWSPDGKWISFTYQDYVLSKFSSPAADHDIDQRNVGVSVPCGPVRVSRDHPRNHDGDYFTVLVTRTAGQPQPGSDEIRKAFEDAWVGTDGYRRADGAHQKRALAFQGEVLTAAGEPISEVFIVDLPDNLTAAGEAPLEGTATRRPAPPRGVQQRRLTFTAGRKYPGIQGPRHWLRSSPDGTQIACLMKDDAGVVQLWTVSPNGGPMRQVTHNRWPIASAFTWSPDRKLIAHVMDNSVFVTEVSSGKSLRLTPRSDDALAPRPEACVVSPDGQSIAYIRTVPAENSAYNQIFTVQIPTPCVFNEK